jgi:hypothetical protein
MFEAKIEDNSEKFEISRDTLVSRRDAHQEATRACVGKTEARIETGQEQDNTEIETYLEEVEANAEEMKANRNADRGTVLKYD